MYSILPSASWTNAEPAALLLPVVEGWLRAGFPSPADDFAIKRQGLNVLLITHPLETFCWRVSAQSMIEADRRHGGWCRQQ